MASTEILSKTGKDSGKIHPITAIHNITFIYFVCEFSYVTYQKAHKNTETLSKDKCEDFQDYHKFRFSVLVF